jgi:hypothetical protein
MVSGNLLVVANLLVFARAVQLVIGGNFLLEIDLLV